MKVWFWSRRDTSVPNEVANGGQYVNPDTWVRAVNFLGLHLELIGWLGNTRGVLPQHVLRLPIPFRRSQHYYQFDPLYVLSRLLCLTSTYIFT